MIFVFRLIGTSLLRPFITGSEEMIKCQEPGLRLMGRFVTAHTHKMVCVLFIKQEHYGLETFLHAYYYSTNMKIPSLIVQTCFLSSNLFSSSFSDRM